MKSSELTPGLVVMLYPGYRVSTDGLGSFQVGTVISTGWTKGDSWSAKFSPVVTADGMTRRVYGSQQKGGRMVAVHITGRALGGYTPDLTLDEVDNVTLVSPVNVWREWTPQAQADVQKLRAAHWQYEQGRDKARQDARAAALAILTEHLPTDVTPGWVARGDEGRITLAELAAIVTAAARHATR